MTRFLLFIALAFIAGCSHATPLTAPTQKPDPSQITYTINLPDAHLVVKLQADNPNGVLMPPLTAQELWDYTAAYGGSPNVYFGETAPWQGSNCAGVPVPGLAEYMNTGIVVAPHAIAALETFTSLDWPNIGLSPNVTYEWVGRFAYAQVGSLASYGVSACK